YAAIDLVGRGTAEHVLDEAIVEEGTPALDRVRHRMAIGPVQLLRQARHEQLRPRVALGGHRHATLRLPRRLELRGEHALVQPGSPGRDATGCVAEVLE